MTSCDGDITLKGVDMLSRGRGFSVLWNLVPREGSLSHPPAVNQLGGLQLVPLPLWTQGSHLSVAGVRLPTMKGSCEASMCLNTKARLVPIFGAQPRPDTQ